MTINLSPAQLLIGLAALVVTVLLWRAGRRRAKRAAEVARAGARLASLAGQILLTAVVMVSVQWIVVTHPGNTPLLLITLALPDLVAAHSLTRALTVTTTDLPRKRGGRR